MKPRITNMTKSRFSKEVTTLLDGMDHPMRDGIDELRSIILDSRYKLSESVKWNGPNYSHQGEDRITIRVYPPKQLQVIFHRGAKVKKQPEQRLLKDGYDILVWKENDRAIVTFKDVDEIGQVAPVFAEIVDRWVEATDEERSAV